MSLTRSKADSKRRLVDARGKDRHLPRRFGVMPHSGKGIWWADMAKRATLRIPGLCWLLVCSLPLIAMSHASTVEVTVTWAGNPDEDDVRGYILCYGAESRTTPGFSRYANEVDVGDVTKYSVTLPDDVPRWHFAVISYDSSRYESDYSPEYRWPRTEEFSIHAVASSGGAVLPKDTVWVVSGGSQRFAISPAFGHAIADVKVDDISVGAVSSYTFSNVAESHTLEASFLPNDGERAGTNSPKSGGGGGGGCFLGSLR